MRSYAVSCPSTRFARGLETRTRVTQTSTKVSFVVFSCERLIRPQIPPVITALIAFRHLENTTSWRADLGVQILHSPYQLPFCVITLHAATHARLRINEAN